MATYDQNGAFWTDFSERRTESFLYSVGAVSAFEADELLLETAEIMSHDEEYFFRSGPAQRLGLI